MAVKRIKGQNFRIFINGTTAAQAVPEETNCTVAIQSNTESAGSKDVDGNWKQDQIVTKSWNVQVESQAADADYLRNILNRFNSFEPGNELVGWDQTISDGGTTHNRTAVNATFSRSGRAFLNDVTITANDRQPISVSCQYTGNGALN